MRIGIGIGIGFRGGPSAPVIPVPVNTVAPAISGTLTDGETVSLSTGTWSPTPDEFERAWTEDGLFVSSASTLDLTGAAGADVQGSVRARLAGGTWSGWIAATGGGVVAPSGSLTLRQQVEALDDPGAVGPRIATTPINPAALPANMTLSGSAITIGAAGTYVGHDFRPYRVKVAAANVILRDCIIVDPGTFGAAGYLFETETGSTDALLEYSYVEGSGNPRRTDDPTANGPGASLMMSQARCKVRRCRLLNFPSDGIKINGDQAIVEENWIGSARSVPAYPAYNSGSTYVLNDWVLFNGRPYRAKGAVPAGNAPSGTSSDTPYWDAPAPHTDYITVLAGTGARVRYNLFDAEAGAFLGATQYVRVIRNTGSSATLGDVQVYANVMRPWPGAYPLAAGYTRPVEDLSNYAAGDIAFQNNRFWQALVAISGAGDRPDVAPAKWQEVVDTNAGDVLFAHNWMADGSAQPFYPFDAHNGQIVVASNKMAADESSYVPRDGMTVLDTIPEPAFRADLDYTAPVAGHIGSDVQITPVAYGKYRVGGATIDACVIRAGARVYCYITPGGVATVPSGVPATVEDVGGGNFVLRLRDLAGNPINGSISVAAGAAMVGEYVSPPAVVSVMLMGQSELAYLLLSGGAYSSLTPKPVLSVEDNLTVITQEGSGNAPVARDVTQAALTAETVNPAMGALAAFLNFARPGVRFVLGDGAVPGTGRPSLYDDTTNGTDGRLWTDFTSVITAMETEAGGPVQHLVECWYNADAGSIGNFQNAFWPFYFGMTGAGGDFTLGTVHNGAQVDHCLWDGAAAPDALGRGVFRKDTTQWHMLTPMPFHNAPVAPAAELTNFSANNARLSEPDRQVIIDMAANAQAVSVGLTVGPSAHVCKFGGASTTIHPDTADKDGTIGLMWPVAIAMLRASGITIGEPVISAIEGATDGSYADLVVDLPNGGNLTTLRSLRGGPAYSGAAPHRQPVTGVEITRSGAARRPVYKGTETSYPAAHRGAVAIVDSGSGTPRKGRVRITPEVPFAFGDKLSYLRGQATAVLLETRDFNLYPDFLIEHVPGLYDSGATYPFEGLAVRPYQADLSAPVDAPAFSPRGAYFDGNDAYRSVAMTGVPAGAQGMASLWFRSADTAWNASTRTLFSFRAGSNVRLEAKTASSGRITVNVYSDGGGGGVTIYAAAGNTQFVTGQWYHMFVEWAGGTIKVWINGLLMGTRAYTTLTMNGENLTQMGIGAQTTGSQYWLGSLAHVWISVTQRLDLSVSTNREKFALAGVPVNLGANGQLPTGTAPEWYYDGDAPAWSNQGMAGSVALDGGPLTAAPVPAPGY